MALEGRCGMSAKTLLEPVAAGDRRALARAITLVESTRADHRREASELLWGLAKTGRQALRIGLSGTPGVGKSTFIEAFGRHLTGLGLKVAVLAVDPSSARTGGAILGDKTRMPELSRDPAAFIRPSPSRTALGGVAAATRSVIALCEGAGFDVVLVETVGVGQSETLVAGMTDVFVLLLGPGGGDELQGVKRGIMEMADILVVNKADGDLAPAAMRTASEYSMALRLLRQPPGSIEGFPKVLTASALEGSGIAEVWEAVSQLGEGRRASGFFAENRADQARRALDEAIHAGLLIHASEDPVVSQTRQRLAEDVVAGRITPDAAAREIVAGIIGSRTE